VVCGTDTGASAVIEITWALILALAHRIATVDRDLHEGRWQSGLGDSVRGKTLGLVGLGRIGARIAAIAPAFGMRVIAWSQNLTAARAAECAVELVERDELFRRADVVSVHLVSSERTRGIVGAHEFGLMKPTAFLVNTARGPIVDERALLDALGTGRIAGAGLDVYDVEPLPPDHPLRRAPNAVLTPHIGYATDGSFRIYYSQMIENIEAWLRGAPIRVLGSTNVTEGQGTAR
jgi:phosphoglycerate dehydrogenase-like enzyme